MSERRPLDRVLDIALRVGAAAFGVMWLVAAASKAVQPDAAYEFTARALGGGAAAKAAVTATAGAEALLGALMLFGAVRGFLLTGAALAAATGLLAYVKSVAGGLIKCGCLALVADANVDQALRRNAWLLAVALGLAAVSFLSSRARRAAAASDPATPAP